MRLSWNEIRARAAAFAHEWQDAAYEKADTQSFYNEFFEIFDVRRRSVAAMKRSSRRSSTTATASSICSGPESCSFEQKSAGRNLARARDQAFEYFDALPEGEKPRYLLVSDFQTFELADLDEDETVTFSLSELPEQVQAFGFIVGVQRRTFRDQDPANIKAAEIVGRLHDALHDARYRGHDLERLLVRLVFCLFADDTGIFEPRDIFLDFIETRTRADGTDLGALLSQLFQVLDTKEANRSPQLDEDLTRFPYVNGRPVPGSTSHPGVRCRMRETLLDACRFDWSHISPALKSASIFSWSAARFFFALGDRGVHGFVVAGFTDTFLETVDLVPELVDFLLERGRAWLRARQSCADGRGDGRLVEGAGGGPRSHPILMPSNPPLASAGRRSDYATSRGSVRRADVPELPYGHIGP